MIDWLPHVNVSLNALATVLLIVGYILIKQKREAAHKKVMLATFGVNCIFLVSYLTYHAYAGSKPFPTDTSIASTPVRYMYYAILLTHVLLAALVPVLAIWTIYLGLKGNRAGHRRLAVVTWPVWLYVSITGIIVYMMLYQIYVPPQVSG